MRFRRRVKLSANQGIDMWCRWKAGQSLHEIGRAFGKDHASIQFMFAQHGGVIPASRSRSPLTLTIAEREDISRGIASGSSIRDIAKGLRRAVSTVSREVARHGGRSQYRASEADHHAWELALRPKVCLLAIQVKLQTIVASKLILDWSPEQISGWLKIEYPKDESMRVSHETIYRSLFIQARGVLKKELIQHLRTKRRIRRSRHSSDSGHRSGQIVDAISIRERPRRSRGPRHSRSLGRRSAGRHQQQSHCNPGGTSFAFCRAGESAQQRHRYGRCRSDPARSQTSGIAASLVDLGSRTGDGPAQKLHGGNESESLLL